MENLDAKQIAIEYCKSIRRDIKNAKSIRNISVQMEESFKKIYKIPREGNLDKFPELKAEVDNQKKLEERAIEIWEQEVQKIIKENNLSEEDIKEKEGEE